VARQPVPLLDDRPFIVLPEMGVTGRVEIYIFPQLSRRQKQLARVISELGGYWPPISAVARILEELGEFAEAYSRFNLGSSDQNISEELADLWIITACIANQFCICLPEGGTEFPQSQMSLAEDMTDLFAQAGQIARAVNYYDGPKPPRSLHNWIPLAKVIKLFHRTLYSIAQNFKIDLDSTIEQKLAISSVRDKGRFADSFDPSAATSLVRFEPIMRSTKCTFAPAAHLWGSPDWIGSQSLRENVRLVLPHLIRFTKCAQTEGIDGFIINYAESSATLNMPALARNFRDLLHELADQDPAVNRSFRGPVDRLGWQFSFNGTRLFISVFSPIYQATHSRHSPSDTFVMFQPETSFDHYSVGSAYPQSPAIKQRIRKAFEDSNIWYPHQLIDTRVEARLYLLPRQDGDAETEWWI